MTSPLIPYSIGVAEEPPEYRQHRYLTKDAGSTFLNPAYAPQEGTEFAGRLQHGIPEPPESEGINDGGSEFGNYVTCHRPR